MIVAFGLPFAIPSVVLIGAKSFQPSHATAK
jgi:hypothetical protein